MPASPSATYPNSGAKADIRAVRICANVGSRTKQKPRDMGRRKCLLTPRLLLLSPDEP